MLGPPRELFFGCTKHEYELVEMSFIDFRHVRSTVYGLFDSVHRTVPAEYCTHPFHGKVPPLSDLLGVELAYKEGFGLGGLVHVSLVYTEANPLPV